MGRETDAQRTDRKTEAKTTDRKTEIQKRRGKTAFVSWCVDSPVSENGSPDLPPERKVATSLGIKISQNGTVDDPPSAVLP